MSGFYRPAAKVPAHKQPRARCGYKAPFEPFNRTTASYPFGALREDPFSLLQRPQLSDKPGCRKAYYVEEIPLDLFHKYRGLSLDSIGARFIKGLFLMYIIPNFFLRQRKKGNIGPLKK